MDLSQLIKKDGNKQIVIGLVLICIALAFILSLILSVFTFQGFLIGISTGITGTLMLISGLNDVAVSKNTRLTMKDADVSQIDGQWPNRMFLEQKINQPTTLYDMNGKAYMTIHDETSAFPFSKTVKWAQTITSIVTGTTVLSLLIANKFKMVTLADQTSWYIHKKAGLQWRGYIFDAQKKCVAYLETTSKEKNLVLEYMDNHGVRWQAYRDVKEFITITDIHKVEQAVLKPGGIPVEAADRFANGNGFLIDWYINDDIPHSLLLFLVAVSKKASIK